MRTMRDAMLAAISGLIASLVLARRIAARRGPRYGVSLYAIVDEGLNPVIGSSAPQAYPLSTHLRGLVGHLVYGAVVALTVEVGFRLLDDEPRHR